MPAPDAETLQDFPFWSQEVTLCLRDTDALVSELLRRPSFVGRQRYAPTRTTLPDGAFITEPHTASEMWDCMNDLPPGTLLSEFNLASDAAVCSIGTGQVYVHPVYLSITTNDPALIRNGEAQLLAGFLPILKNKNSSGAVAEMFRRWARVVRHECMRFIDFIFVFRKQQMATGGGPEPAGALSLSTTPREYGCSAKFTDGLSGKSPFPVLLYELQSYQRLLFMFSCDQTPDALGDGPGELRTSAKSAALRAQGTEVAREHGLHMEKPYFDEFDVNGHRVVRANSLHQLEGGACKQINLNSLTIPYFKNACGGGGALFTSVLEKIVHRLACIPPYSDLHRFKDSITFGQWTHESSRALMVIISGALYNLTWEWDKPPREIEEMTTLDGVGQSFAFLAIIYLYANSLESTATDRANMEYAVSSYYEVIKDVFEEEREKLGFNWMKLHSLWHYAAWTETDGVPSHSNTSCYKTAHKLIKEFWRASNKCESLKQIMWANIRHDVMASFRIRLERSGTIPIKKDFQEPTYLAARTVLSARGEHLRKMTLRELGVVRNLGQLETLTNAFLSEHIGLPTRFDGKASVHPVASASFPIYEPPAVPTFDSCRTMSQVIYAKDKYYYRAGSTDPGVYGPRFDTVLVRNDDWAEDGNIGWRGLDVYRVRLFFSIRFEGRRLDLCLADVWTKVRSSTPSKLS
ncbi:hypothetical protein P7C70_g7207, partial [Phenoliferia sp. Uapishka_3]